MDKSNAGVPEESVTIHIDQSRMYMYVCGLRNIYILATSQRELLTKNTIETTVTTVSLDHMRQRWQTILGVLILTMWPCVCVRLIINWLHKFLLAFGDR